MNAKATLALLVLAAAILATPAATATAATLDAPAASATADEPARCMGPVCDAINAVCYLATKQWCVG